MHFLCTPSEQVLLLLLRGRYTPSEHQLQSGTLIPLLFTCGCSTLWRVVASAVRGNCYHFPTVFLCFVVGRCNFIVRLTNPFYGTAYPATENKIDFLRDLIFYFPLKNNGPLLRKIKFLRFGLYYYFVKSSKK